MKEKGSSLVLFILIIAITAGVIAGGSFVIKQSFFKPTPRSLPETSSQVKDTEKIQVEKSNETLVTSPSSVVSLTPEQIENNAINQDVAVKVDLFDLMLAINQYLKDNSLTAVALCRDDTLPCRRDSSTGTFASDGTGWIKIDLSKQKAVTMPKLPGESKNNRHYYVFCADKTGWEIDAVFISKKLSPLMINDNGDDDQKVEVGTNLNLIDKVTNCKF